MYVTASLQIFIKTAARVLRGVYNQVLRRVACACAKPKKNRCPISSILITHDPSAEVQ